MSDETNWDIDNRLASALSMDERWIELGMKKKQ